MILKLTLEYDGSGFRGWARQPGLRTVEGVVREALDVVYPRWDGLALTIRNRLASRHRAALATGIEQPGPMLSQEQVVQVMTQLVDKGLLVVARGADYTRRVSVTEAGRAALPAE